MQERDSGWVELLRGEPPQVVGRARAIVTFAPLPPGGAPNEQRGQLVAIRDAWEGRLDPLRLEAGVSLETGPHHIRFEENGETLLISIDDWHAMDHGTSYAVIHSLDQQVPSSILELGGE